MKKSFLSLFVHIVLFCHAQQPSLQERLGYSEDSRLLIIHADDLGVAHSENMASISAFEKGMVNSGSIMVPCPWFPEIANYAANNPQQDLGLHLTLTAEWKEFKWGPVSGRDAVPGLVNEQGYFYDNCGDVVTNASAEEIEKEITAQIEKALAAGVPVTHLDSHMGCLFNPQYFTTYLNVARKYKLPALLTISGLRQFPGMAEALLPSDVVIGDVLMLYPGQAPDGVDKYYENLIRNLEPGVTEILIHVAYDDEEMNAVCIDHPDYGAAWRQADYDFFTSPECKKILKEENIQLVTWGQLKNLSGK